MNDLPEHEVAIFSAARRLAGGERAAYLDEACAGDAALRRRLDELLRVNEGEGDFLEKPALGVPDAAAMSGGAIPPSLPLSEKPGDRIGPYKLLQQIGEGGCGVVYMADQEAPIRRRVALKVIKLGMDTKQVIARFEAERQALALMDHPNIARVLDAGATETGRPYFVMELVRGTKITDYCDQQRLSTRARLDLFMKVCQAIQHAHQKGVIHRDIKPSNILVTINDGAAVPKVIDFGIAKATQGRLTDKKVFTAFEQFIGTPAYMSPEQAELTSLDVDTRSDIYSLGVLLYELLTGQTPFDSKELLAKGLDEMRRTIREQEPRRPSNRLTTMEEGALTTTAQRRQTDPPKLVHLVQGDLDWIVMKCLEKDRSRRYETANGLVFDLRRHLNNEAVLARPPSNWYRFQKMARRNKLAFAAATAVAASLVIGFGIATWMYVKERAARQRAVAAEQKQIGLRLQAAAEASKSRQVAQFLEDMLYGIQPSVALGRDTSLLREILDRTADRVGHDLTNQPIVEAEMRGVIGTVYLKLDQYDKAEAMYRGALDMKRKLLGEDHPDVAVLLDRFQDLLMREGKLAEAQALSRQAVAIKRKVFGYESPGVADSLNGLSMVLRFEGKLAEAETVCREALEMRRKLLGDEHADVALSHKCLGLILQAEGKLTEAEATFREALAIRRKLLRIDHPGVVQSLYDLATVLAQEGKLAEAETMYREALPLARKVWADIPARPEDFLSALVDVLLRERKPDEIEKLFDDLLPPGEERQPGNVGVLRVRADFQARLGNWREAAADLIKVVGLAPSNYLDYHGLSPLLVASGDLENYRHYCREIVVRFGDTTDPFIGDRMAKDCLIVPSSEADVEVVTRWADTAVATGSNNAYLPYFQCTKGLAEYRQGHIPSALTWINKTLEIGQHRGDYTWDDYLYVEAYAVSAMAHCQLKQTDAARAALAQATEAADTKLPKLDGGPIGSIWRDWIIAHTLLAEAKAFVEGDTNKGGQVE